MLEKIGQSGGRNPSQESEYRELLRQAQQNQPAPVAALAPAVPLQDIVAKQQAQQQALLGRFTTGIETARTAAETELGLPQLRQTTQVAGQTARDTARQTSDVLQGIQPRQETIAKQVGISAPRLQQRIATETGARSRELQPGLETARRSLEDALAGQQFGETEYTRRLQETTQPFQLEASMLSESLAREFSGYSQQLQNELDVTLQKMNNNQALSMAEIQRAQQLADQEADFERQKQMITFQSQAGIGQEQQLKSLGLGSYYQKPKVGSISKWEYV